VPALNKLCAAIPSTIEEVPNEKPGELIVRFGCARTVMAVPRVGHHGRQAHVLSTGFVSLSNDRRESGRETVVDTLW
jgi:hypothetical protein